MNRKRIYIIAFISIILLTFLFFWWMGGYYLDPEIKKMTNSIQKKYGNELTLKSINHNTKDKILDCEFKLSDDCNPSICNEVRKLFNQYLQAHSSENYEVSIYFYFFQKPPYCTCFTNNSILNNTTLYDSLSVIYLDIFASGEYSDLLYYKDYTDIKELILKRSTGYKNLDSILNYSKLNYLEYRGTFTEDFKKRLNNKFPECQIFEYHGDQH